MRREDVGSGIGHGRCVLVEIGTLGATIPGVVNGNYAQDDDSTGAGFQGWSELQMTVDTDNVNGSAKQY